MVDEPSPSTAAAVGTLFGPFWIETRLAVGGMSEVYLAHPMAPDATLPETVIVKRLLPHYLTDQEVRRMFVREAELHRSVSHSNVVKVFQAGQVEDGEPYLVMEYVEGIDAYRLLRRFRQEQQRLPIAQAVHMMREILAALDCVHSACSDQGKPLGIVHRDVSPSNIYLSMNGIAKLGDFGIAFSDSRSTSRGAGALLKGKIGYLSPEQVAGETFDHRSDLFGAALVLAEAILGQPVFSGGGQLAILLAIRDCRLDALAEAKGRIPPALYSILEKGLARDPRARFATAAELREALAPFDPDAEFSQRRLAESVQRIRLTKPSTDSVAAIRESAKFRNASSVPIRDGDTSHRRGSSATDLLRATDPYITASTTVFTEAGQELGPWSFARLVEAIATGQIGRDDRAAYGGQPPVPISEITDLARFLPPQTADLDVAPGEGGPEWKEVLSVRSLVTILCRIEGAKETGALVVEGGTESKAEELRKEIYFLRGRLHHVVSSDATELFGEYLTRRGLLAREELDFALAVLPKYGGRIGDTLIALGLCGPMDIFRAIREQGRDRVVGLFSWKRGDLEFHKGRTVEKVDFPLDMDICSLVFLGLGASRPFEQITRDYAHHLKDQLVAREIPAGEQWPSTVKDVFAACKGPSTVKTLLGLRPDVPGRAQVLHAVEILLALNAIVWAKASELS